MKTTALILFAFVAFALSQDFPSTSRTWTTEGSNQRLINITGAEALKYPIGYLKMDIKIGAGKGVLFFGIGERRSNITVDGGSSVIYEKATSFCTLDGTAEKPFYVYLESPVAVSYRVTLTQSSTELPNDKSMTVNMIPPLFKGIPWLISTGDVNMKKTISITIISAVPLGYLDGAVIEAREKCTGALQLQSFPVTSGSDTTWTFTGQFDAGYENYTLTLIPSEKQSIFSTFYVTASVTLDQKVLPADNIASTSSKSNLLIMIGVALLVVSALITIAVVAITAYLRRPPAYIRILLNPMV